MPFSKAVLVHERIADIAASQYLTVYSIHKPLECTPQTPIVLYIPAISPASTEESNEIPGPLLRNVVIRITPRWSPRHWFPVPIHDTLQAYDWVVCNIFPDVETLPHSRVPPIGVYGKRLGGALATSLALTECRPARRARISALVTADGVFDWTAVATASSTSELVADLDAEEADDLTAAELFNMRRKLFGSPRACFDSFASPLTFFRTPGVLAPRDFPMIKRSALPLSDRSPPLEPELHVTRRSHLVYPPRKSGLVIPYSLLLASRDGWLADQTQEMARLMQRSVLLHEMKERLEWDPDINPPYEAGRRVCYILAQDQDERAAAHFAAVFGGSNKRTIP